MDADLQVIKNYVDANIKTNHAQSITGPIDNSALTQILTAIQNTRGATGAITRTVTQPGHGLAAGNAVYFNGTKYIKARANAEATLGMFIVSLVEGESFTIIQCGFIEGLSGLTSGSIYYVSQSSAGALTATKPTSGLLNPLMLAISTTQGFVFPWFAFYANIKSIKIESDEWGTSGFNRTITKEHNLGSALLHCTVYHLSDDVYSIINASCNITITLTEITIKTNYQNCVS